jgi:hypothetical protein
MHNVTILALSLWYSFQIFSLWMLTFDAQQQILQTGRANEHEHPTPIPPTFRKNILPPSSRSKTGPSKQEIIRASGLGLNLASTGFCLLTVRPWRWETIRYRILVRNMEADSVDIRILKFSILNKVITVWNICRHLNRTNITKTVLLSCFILPTWERRKIRQMIPLRNCVAYRTASRYT